MSAVESLESLEPSELLAERAYAELSKAILTNQLAPGTRLSVPELARQLDISRSPVREAVQRLIYDGLAENRGRRGAVVAQIGLDGFLSLLEVREPLEGLAARQAALRGSDDDLGRIGELLGRHRSTMESGRLDEADHVELDLAFHAAVRAAAGNDDLSTMLARTQARAHLSFSTLWLEPRNPAHAVAEHEAIFTALVARDPDAADEAARNHIRALRERVISASGAAQ